VWVGVRVKVRLCRILIYSDFERTKGVGEKRKTLAEERSGRRKIMELTKKNSPNINFVFVYVNVLLKKEKARKLISLLK